MGQLRGIAQWLFGLLLLTALWVTALSFLSARPTATGIITDLSVDALNPWLVSRHIGIDQTLYGKLQQAASADPSAALPLLIVKPKITGAEIKDLPYQQGLRVIFSQVAGAYYDGGPQAAFALPGPVAGAAQYFALFPEQYDAAVKAAPLPDWLRPFLVYTGLSPDTFTAVGHARLLGDLKWFWGGALALAGAVFAFSLLSRRKPFQSVAWAVWHAAWPPLALFAVFFVIGRLYPARVQPISEAFGLVAGAFLPVYGVAAAVGLGSYLVFRFGGGLLGAAGRASARPAPVPVGVRAGRSAAYDSAPPYVPNAPRPDVTSSAAYQGYQQPAPPYVPYSGAQPPTQGYQGGPASPSPWPGSPQSGGQGGGGQDGAWREPGPWVAPAGQPPAQPGQGRTPRWEPPQPAGPDDPTMPRW